MGDGSDAAASPRPFPLRALSSVSLFRSLRAPALVSLAFAPSLVAQPAVDLHGLAYIDYAHRVLSAGDDEGTGSFDYRRIFLTADGALDDAFRMRLRLEASGRSRTVQDRPSPFVKDAWVEWRYAASGHRATLGLQQPPVADLSESVWGYRSLDQTVLDRTGYRGFRDLGLRLDGPLAGAVSYVAMVGNGNGERPEDAGDRGKTIYGQLVVDPSGPFVAALGGDVETEQPAGGVRQSSARVSGLVAAVAGRLRGGAEAYYVSGDPGTLVEMPADPGPSVRPDGVGGSVFGALPLTARTALVARYDYIDADARRAGFRDHYVIAALAYQPAEAVRLLPTVLVAKRDGATAAVTARVTVEAHF